MLALGLKTMPFTPKPGAAVIRKNLEACRQGTACDRDHKHLFPTHWTKSSAINYIKSLTTMDYDFFTDPRNEGFADEIVTAINAAPASRLP